MYICQKWGNIAFALVFFFLAGVLPAGSTVSQNRAESWLERAFQNGKKFVISLCISSGWQGFL
jgi:hypothetical protein